jgi:hypothetical protein
VFRAMRQRLKYQQLQRARQEIGGGIGESHQSLMGHSAPGLPQLSTPIIC